MKAKWIVWISLAIFGLTVKDCVADDDATGSNGKASKLPVGDDLQATQSGDDSEAVHLPGSDELEAPQLLAGDDLEADLLPAGDDLENAQLPTGDDLEAAYIPAEDDLQAPSEDNLKADHFDVKNEDLLAGEDMNAKQLPAGDDLEADQVPADDNMKAEHLPAGNDMKSEELPTADGEMMTAEEDLEADNLHVADDLEAGQLPAEENLEADNLPAEKELKGGHSPADKNIEADHSHAEDDLDASHLLTEEDQEAEHLPANEDLEAEHLPAEEDLKAEHLPDEKDLQAEHLPAEQDQVAENVAAEDDLEAGHLSAEEDLEAEHLSSEEDLEAGHLPAEENPLDGHLPAEKPKAGQLPEKEPIVIKKTEPSIDKPYEEVHDPQMENKEDEQIIPIGEEPDSSVEESEEHSSGEVSDETVDISESRADSSSSEESFNILLNITNEVTNEKDNTTDISHPPINTDEVRDQEGQTKIKGPLGETVVSGQERENEVKGHKGENYVTNEDDTKKDSVMDENTVQTENKDQLLGNNSHSEGLPTFDCKSKVKVGMSEEVKVTCQITSETPLTKHYIYWHGTKVSHRDQVTKEGKIVRKYVVADDPNKKVMLEPEEQSVSLLPDKPSATLWGTNGYSYYCIVYEEEGVTMMELYVPHAYSQMFREYFMVAENEMGKTQKQITLVKDTSRMEFLLSSDASLVTWGHMTFIASILILWNLLY